MQIIGDYVVHRVIGEGATGKVYEAEQQGTRRQVALKVIHAELGRSADVRARLTEELSVLTRLDNANIVKCLSCKDIDGRVVIAFELLDGQTLRSRLGASGRLPWRDAVHLSVQIAHALAAAHALDPPMVHRDLKPENVFVVAGNTAKVTDFGVARVLGAAGQTTTAAFGNIKYMSPEQIDAWGIDARSDVYCLGLLLYELLSGDVPFTGSSPRELLNAQCTQPLPPFSAAVQAEVPADLERLIHYMLEKSADARPQTAAQVAQLMQSVLHDQPIHIPPPGSSTGPRSVAAPPSTKPAPVGAIVGAAVAGLVALGGGGYFLLSSDDDATAGTSANAGSQASRTDATKPKGRPTAKKATPASSTKRESKPPTEVEDPPPNEDEDELEDEDETPVPEEASEEPPEDKLDVGTQLELSDESQRLLGFHTCGVLQFHPQGECEFYVEDGQMKIRGVQKAQGGDYFEIKGTVENPKKGTLVVNGTIKTRSPDCKVRNTIKGGLVFRRMSARTYRLRERDRLRIFNRNICYYYPDIRAATRKASRAERAARRKKAK